MGMLEVMEDADKMIFCEVCDAETEEATARCFDCNHYLCVICKTIHFSIRETRHHYIVNLRELRKMKTSREALASVGTKSCDESNEKPLDETPSDEHCASNDPAGAFIASEWCIDISKRREDMVSLLQDTNQAVAKLDTVLNQNAELSRSIETAAMTAQEKVDQAADRAMVAAQARIFQTRDEHREAIKILEAEREKILSDQRDTLQNTLTKTSSITNKIEDDGACHEVLQGYRVLTDAMKHVRAGAYDEYNELDKFEFTPNYLNSGSTQPLGRIQGAWVLQRELTEHGVRKPRRIKAVAVGNCGEIAVIERPGQTAHVLTRDGKRRLTFTATVESLNSGSRADIETINGAVQAVAFTKTGHVIICDCSVFVKIFSRQRGRYLGAFMTTTPTDLCRVPVSLNCLAVDDNGRIYVGDYGRRCVTVHDPSGVRLRLIECTRPMQLAVGSDHLVVVPSDQLDSIKILDKAGVTRAALNIPEATRRTWLPVSIAVSASTSDSIFVVNGHEDGQREIHEWDLKGDYQGCALTDSEVSPRPVSIAFIRTTREKHELLVAGDNSIKIFRKI